MSALIYYLALPLVYLLSLLPFRALHILSDLLYLLLYKIMAYRRTVVRENLQKSFPEKSAQELQLIEKKFYQYFCDLILETTKTLTIRPSTVLRRVSMKNPEVYKPFFEQGQSVVIVMGHFGNWELAGARFSQEPYHQLYVIYHPMRNKYFDQLLYRMRTRLGNKLYPMRDTFKGMVQNRKDITATAFIADQTPSPHHAYWTTFLAQDTPIFTGTAKISRKLGYPIIYVSIKRSRRGYYDIHSELLVEKPQKMAEDAISELHTRRLEKDIQRHPHLWLWTHRRWKHRKPHENSLTNTSS